MAEHDKEVRIKLVADTSDFDGKINSAVGKAKKSFGDFAKGIMDMAGTFAEISTATNTTKNRMKDLEKQIKSTEKTLKDKKETTERLREELIKLQKENEELNNAEEKNASAIMKNIQEQTRLTKTYRDTDNEVKKLKGTVENLIKEYDKLSGKTEETKSSMEKLKEGASSLKDAFTEFNKGNFGEAFESLKDAGQSLFTAMPGWAKAVTALYLGLQKLYNMGTQRFFTGLQDIKQTLAPIGNVISSVGRSFVNSFESITGFDLSLSNAIETAVEFEDTITRAGAIMGATGKDFDELEASARELGATTRYSASEVAEAYTYMGMAGWSVEASLAGIEGVLNLATVGSLSLAQASDFVTDGLTALGMSAGQANDFVDMLSATITNANTNVEQMQGAFTNVAPIAGTLGVSMSDLSVAIGLMSDNGVKAERAGTALKNLMTNMIQPTEKQIACIQKYNLETAQQLMQQGKLIESIQEIKKQTEGLSASEKAQIAVTIAGKEALSGVSALLNTTPARIKQLQFAVDSSTKSGRKFAESLVYTNEAGDKTNLLLDNLDFNNLTDNQKKAIAQWENFNSVMEECGDTATWVGASTTDLGAIIHKLGEDGEVTADQVNNVLDLFDKIRDTGEKTTSTLKEYGIEVAYTDDKTVDFGETLKNVGAKWDTLTDSQKKALASQLGLKGGTKELDELFANNGETIEKLIDEYEKAKGVSDHLAETFDLTLKGAMMNLASAIEERLLQAFDKMKPAVMAATEVLTKFFDTWNTEGLTSALDYLVDESAKLGEAIRTGLVNAISSIDQFINGGALDSILQIGTNIIDGICKGIMEAKDNGTLDSAIDGFITKICDWINLNGPKVEEAGKTILNSLRDGITRNKDKLSSAMDTLYSVINTWIQGKKGIIQESAIAMGTSVVEGIAIGLVQDAVGSIGSGFAFLVTTIGGCVADAISTMIDLGKSLFDGFMEGFLGEEDWSRVKTEFGEAVDWVMDLDEKLGGENGGTTSKAQDAGLDTGKKYGDGVDKGLKESKEKTDTSANEIGTGISEQIGNGLASMDTTQLQALEEELRSVGTTTTEVASEMGTAFTSIQDSARTSFMGFANIVRNQMLNVSNIVRNQMLNCTSIVKNQATNMANAVRTQFVNMANIARNQFVNIANICRNQMVNCTNIVRNQCVNMANIFRNQFVNMANICRNQMLNCTNIVRNQATNMSNALRSGLSNMASSAQSAMNRVLSVIRSAMAQARAIASSPITINIKSNVSRTVTTTHVAGGLKQTMADIASNSISVSRANTMAGTGSSGVVNTVSRVSGGEYMFTIPIMLDGREIARASAKYNEKELAKLEKRNSRKRGE